MKTTDPLALPDANSFPRPPAPPPAWPRGSPSQGARLRPEAELTFLSWNHFVPASDDELRKQAEAFGKVANCTVRVDTMAHLQMPTKIAARPSPGGPRHVPDGRLRSDLLDHVVHVTSRFS